MAAYYLGDYCAGRILGKGGFGVVQECYHMRSNMKVAIKVIKIKSGPNAERETNEVLKEAKLMITLNHPHIVTALDIFCADKSICIAMEFCDKGDLQTYIHTYGPVEEERVIKWLKQIASGLEYLHEENILHRDIKPSNILLTGKQLDAKLGDLGLAKILEYPSLYANTYCGTLYYMSPEVTNKQPYNAKSDIWALGISVYQMVSSHMPRNVDSVQECIKFVQEKGRFPSIPKQYSENLIDLMKCMLHLHSKKRYSASQVLNHALFQDQKEDCEKVLALFKAHMVVTKSDVYGDIEEHSLMWAEHRVKKN